MSSDKPTIDGFIPRRRPDGAPSLSHIAHPRQSTVGVATRPVAERAPRPEATATLNPDDISRSLAKLDTPSGDQNPPKKRRFRGSISKRKLIKRLIIVLVLCVVAYGLFIGGKFLIANANVFNGNPLGFIQTKPLKQDANGRTNIVIFGTSEDDPGHDGPLLSDSIMVVSINQTTYDAFTFSIPRDLWVDYGASCIAGNSGRINVVYQCRSEDGANEPAGADAMRSVVSEVTGMDIQYYAHINYSVVRDTVDAVGGVDVDIQSNPVELGGVLDRNFDWKCQYQCYYVKYDNGVHHLDGEHALYLARARGDDNGQQTYGFAQSNYDREKNQQKIAKATLAKALSAGTLANPIAVTNLIDALGNNLRTNFDTTEIRTLISIAQKTKPEAVHSISLVDADPAVIGGAMISGMSVQQATSGATNYSSIINYLKKQISSDPVVREAPTIAVFNGGAPSGSAQTLAESLEARGFTASYFDTTYEFAGSYEVYDVSNGDKSASKTALEGLYGAISTKTLPVTVSGVDFVIIIGSGLPASAQ